MKKVLFAVPAFLLLSGVAAHAATPSHANLSYADYPNNCISCHDTQFTEMLGATHYKWVGEAPDMVNGVGVAQGKLTNAINSYCINIEGDWKICGKCHAGRGLRPDDPAADKSNIDCLACHNEEYAMQRTRLADGSMGVSAPTDTMVQNVHKPKRANCLKCHANAGGGNAVKRGDLAMENITNTDPHFDVHMNTSSPAGNLSCQSCHVFQNHKTIGKGSDLRPTDDLTRGAEVKCTTCHNSNPHGSNYTPDAKVGSPSDAFTRDRHANENVACQTCHIPTFAKVATEMHRDWTHHHDGTPADGVSGPGHPHVDKQANVIPEYAWWNRLSDNYLLGDDAALTYDAAKDIYPTSRPLGGFLDGKVYPFKYKTAYQPKTVGDDRLIALDTLEYIGISGDVVKSIESGLVNMGYPANEPYEWVTTDTYQLINHGVEPKSGALKCADCHSMSGETTNSRMPFAELGYHTWPAKVRNCTLCHDPEEMPWREFHEYHAENMGKDCKGCHTTEPTGWIEPVTPNGLCNNCHSGDASGEFFEGIMDAQKLHMVHAESEHGGVMRTTCTDCHTF